jgi:hypothetical protein
MASGTGILKRLPTDLEEIKVASSQKRGLKLTSGKTQIRRRACAL